MQLHPVFLLPRHDGQLGGHVLEAVPRGLVLWSWLVLKKKKTNKKNKKSILAELKGALREEVEYVGIFWKKNPHY